MHSKQDAPSAKDIDIPKLHHVLSLYPAVLQSFYRGKLKGDAQKHKEALQDDEWRYHDLPSEVAGRKPGAGLTKAELERLVKWKITHQTNRPFLLPQIRKNDAKAVERCTADARQILLDATSTKPSPSDGPSRHELRKALDKVCELSGVGPATGTLLLSVFDDQNVPFFEDELYAWLIPNSAGKLKYNVKEYFEMLDKFTENLETTIKRESPSVKMAATYEKVAFVCQHWDLVETHISQEAENSDHTKQLDRVLQKDDKNERPVAAGNSQQVPASRKGQMGTKRKGTDSENAVAGARRSKRTRS